MQAHRDPCLVLLVLMLAWGTACAPPPGSVAPERRAAEEAARKAIANERAIEAAAFPQYSLGITPFEVNARDTALSALGYGLSDLLTTDLARSRRLEIVDRLRLDAVLREIHLAEAGRVDTATAPRVGKLVHARRLVLGNLTQRPSGNLFVTADIADVASGELRPAVGAATTLDDILQAEKELAFRLFDQLGVTLTPAERSAVEQLPTKNVAAFLAYSRGVRFDAEGRYPEARAEFRQAIRLDPGFRAAQQHLESLLAATVPSGAEQQASSSAAQAADQVTNGINGVFISPIGSLDISPPGSGSTDLVLPTTITIIVGVEP